MNEVKKAIEGRLACETWDASTKHIVTQQATLVMERATQLAADKGKLPVNGNLPPVIHVITNELITNIVDMPDAMHLVPAVARKIGVMAGRYEEESPHHAKAARRGESGVTRA